MKVRNWYFVSAVIATIVLTLFSLVSTDIPLFQNLELGTVDYRFNRRGPVSVEDSPIVIVEIDNQSYESMPERWPWPRNYYAHLISNLNRAGAKVIAIDVVLDKPQVGREASDQALSDTLNKYDNVVLIGKDWIETGKGSQIKDDKRYIKPLDQFLVNKTTWGMGSVGIDQDGLYRKYIPVQKGLPSFALAIAQKYYDLDADDYFRDGDMLFVGDKIVIPFPKNEQEININFYGHAYSFRYFSFDSVIDDENFTLAGDNDLDYFDILAEEGHFKDKIVMIGATLEELHDRFPTPFLLKDGKEVETPGVEIHATALQNMLMNQYVTVWAGIFPPLILILLTLAIFLITWFGKTWQSLLAFLLFSIGWIYYAFWQFETALLIVEMVPVILAMFLVFTSTNIIGYLLTQKEKKQIRGAFAHYVPADVVNELIANPDKLQLGGEERFMSVMFSDVAGFTTISEKLTPHELVELLNEYLTAMTDIVLENKGIIDKYEGDAIMAEFGAPIYYEEHAIKACETAILMQQKLVEMRQKWAEEGRPQLQARVGINTGNMVVGNMGSRDVFDYTVMGDAVNLGSRLEGANKPYGTYIMISQTTYDLVKEHFYARPLDLLAVKGKTEPIKVYELMALKNSTTPPEVPELAAKFATGMDFYFGKKFAEAIKIFEQCLSLREDDRPSLLFIDRCKAFIENPPGEYWDGVFVMTTK
jgi:adenylate cyclase